MIPRSRGAHILEGQEGVRGGGAISIGKRGTGAGTTCRIVGGSHLLWGKKKVDAKRVLFPGYKKQSGVNGGMSAGTFFPTSLQVPVPLPSPPPRKVSFWGGKV